ncbi:SUMF1/EgtB/PvdO family nonheme iron enzyme [Pseudoalteromonas xiamenensis]
MASEHTIDSQIKKAKTRRKSVVLAGITVFIAFLSVYLSVLFLVKGFNVSISPLDAQQEASISIHKGLGIVRNQTAYVLFGEAELQIEAKTFKSTSIQVNAQTPSNLLIELLPKPAVLRFTTDVESVQFDWLVDGDWKTRGNALEIELAPGSHEIIAKHEWYENTILNYDAVKASDDEVQLHPTKRVGTVTIASVPKGAAVSINGEVVGITPYHATWSAGDYQLGIQAGGYEQSLDQFSLNKSITAIERTYTLLPLQASLELALTPEGGLLTVNGLPKTPDEGTKISVDANTLLTVQYQKQGFITQDRRVTLSPKQQGALALSLEPDLGQVKFSSNVNATVSVNGKTLGHAPLSLSLQTVPLEVTFSKQGYRSQTRTIMPLSKKVLNVEVELLTEFEARRKEGKPSFVSKLGIDFINVAGGKFETGSPVNEAERFRDEHQLPVELTKAFLVAATEITEAQYHKFDQSVTPSNLPLVNVTWLDAVRYCNWLSEQEGLRPFYRVQGSRVSVPELTEGYRLLSEAEWEFVAKHFQRAARTTFVWGNEERVRKGQGNFADESIRGKQTFILEKYQDGFAQRAPVKSFNADRNGFYDLDGNVREWVSDGYQVIKADDSDVLINPIMAIEEVNHVIKGGSFKTGRLKMLRASVKGKGDGQLDDVGFRIARYVAR